ncbi:MAG: hypothetical protein ACFFDN_00180 [Candidatus Hodarchaeota archaeon]
MGLVKLLEFIVYLMVVPMEFIFNRFFVFVPRTLKIMCVSMLVVSISKYLKYYESKLYQILRWFLYGWFLIYLAYVLGYFNMTETEELEILEWVSIGIAIITPLCVLIVYQIGKKWLSQRLPFDVYYIAMIIYLIIGIVWNVLYPEQIHFMYYVYWFFLFAVFNYLVYRLSRGILNRNDDQLWKRIFILILIISFTVFVAIMTIIVPPSEIEKDLAIEVWWFGLLGIGIFGVLSILFFQTPYKNYLILLMLGSESLLFIDIEDFLKIFRTDLGIMLYLLIVFIVALILYFYTKRAKAIGIALLIAIAFSVAFVFFVAINDETYFENWAIGLSFACLFIIFYLVPPGKLWTIVKPIHLSLIIFFLSLFLIDFADFVLMLRQLYI